MGSCGIRDRRGENTGTNQRNRTQRHNLRLVVGEAKSSTRHHRQTHLDDFASAHSARLPITNVGCFVFFSCPPLPPFLAFAVILFLPSSLPRQSRQSKRCVFIKLPVMFSAPLPLPSLVIKLLCLDFLSRHPTKLGSYWNRTTTPAHAGPLVRQLHCDLYYIIVSAS